MLGCYYYERCTVATQLSAIYASRTMAATSMTSIVILIPGHNNRRVLGPCLRLFDLRNSCLNKIVPLMDHTVVQTTCRSHTTRVTNNRCSCSRNAMHIIALVRTDPDKIGHIATCQILIKLRKRYNLFYSLRIVHNRGEVHERIMLLSIELDDRAIRFHRKVLTCIADRGH